MNKSWLVWSHLGCIMVSVFVLSVAEGGFEHRSGKTKDYAIVNCCVFDKHASLRIKNTRLVVQSWFNVFWWCTMSICWLLIQWASIKNPTQHVGLVTTKQISLSVKKPVIVLSMFYFVIFEIMCGLFSCFFISVLLLEIQRKEGFEYH